MKKCKECRKIKSLREFYQHKSSINKIYYFSDCISCSYKKNQEYKKKHPWMNHYHAAKNRCNNKNNIKYPLYGGRGIRFNLTSIEIKNLWARDNAVLMEKPSIERINNDGNYEHSNCKFIEQRENSSLKGSRHPKAIFDEAEVLLIRKQHFKEGIPITFLSNKHGVTRQCIYRIVNRLAWKHI